MTPRPGGEAKEEEVKPVHANDYDTIQMWCERNGDQDRNDCEERANGGWPDCVGGSGSPDAATLAEVTCGECLVAIIQFGEAAKARLNKLPPLKPHPSQPTFGRNE